MYNVVLDKQLNGLGQRLAAARKSRRLSAQQFCDELRKYGIDISRPAVGKWERGESVPSAYQLLAAAYVLGIEDCLSYFSGVQKEASLNGEGLRKLEDYREDLIASGRYSPCAPQVQRCRIIEMPVCRLRASAGTGSFLDEGGFDSVSVPEAQVPAGADFGIYISGDSMEPRYHDGDIAWVRECRELSAGEIGIFTYDGDGYIKEYGEQLPAEELRERFTDSEGILHRQPVLRSLNSRYAPKPVSPERYFRIIGRVLN